MNYYASRLPGIMLPADRVHFLTQNDPTNPYLRRHLAASRAISTILHPRYSQQSLLEDWQQSFLEDKSKIHRVPSVVKHEVSRLNREYLTYKTDIQLSAHDVWQVIYYGCIHPTDTASSHRCLYIQDRKWTPSENAIGRQKRQKTV